jgi:L-Ala-D/L-Glu epimerase / N-acetyl-D-glutamate racemase
VDAHFSVYEARLRAPLLSATGGQAARPLVLLQLHAPELGVTGWGEAAPLEEYDGVSVETVLGELERCVPTIERASGADPEALRCACSELTTVPQALAAIDLALWDLSGRAAGKPVWELIEASSAAAVRVNATIGAEEPLDAASEAVAAVSAGFRCVKLKVGVGDDLGRVRAVRAAIGPSVAIRLDANGAWEASYAEEILGLLADQDLELCEEPVHGLDLLADVSGVGEVAVAADESGSDPGVFDHRYCEALCLKISRCGGITGVLRDAAAARAVGYEVYLASTLDGPLGIAAALHAAAVVQPDRFSGLATLGRFDGVEGFTVVDGVMTAPAGIGLGDGLADWYQ